MGLFRTSLASLNRPGISVRNFFTLAGPASLVGGNVDFYVCPVRNPKGKSAITGQKEPVTGKSEVFFVDKKQIKEKKLVP